VTLRLATPADAAGVAAIYAPIVASSVISFEVEPPSVETIAARIASTLARLPWLVSTDDDGVAGYAYASPHRERAAYRWSVEVSVYVAERARRRRLAQSLYGRLFEILAAQGFTAAWAGIVLPNAASVALHESVGFRPVGVYRGVGFKFGAWHDVAWFGRDLAPRTPDPPEPTPLPALLLP
jgi:phosphinothricin acetyltransferase